MKIMMTRENLGRMLKGVSYAVAKRATMPAMENVEIGPTQAGDYIRAFCGMTGCAIEIRMPGLVLEGGKAIVRLDPLQKFVDACKGSADMTLTRNDDNTLLVECGKSKLKLNGFDEKASPRSLFLGFGEPQDGETVFSMRNGDFLSGVRSVSCIAGKELEDARANTKGLHISASTDGLVSFAATDGRRLAEAVKGCQGDADKAQSEPEKPCEGTVPSGSVAVLSGMLAWASPSDLVRVAMSDGDMMLSSENWTCSMSLMAEKFVDYSRLLPMDGYATKVILPRQQFLESLKRVMLMSMDNDTPNVRISVDNQGTCLLEAEGKTGSAKDAFECECDENGVPYCDGAVKAKFNGAFLTDVLPNADFGDGGVVMRYKSEVEPIHILASDDSFHYVLMPMRDN